jgi:hypothetical protein
LVLQNNPRRNSNTSILSFVTLCTSLFSVQSLEQADIMPNHLA